MGTIKVINRSTFTDYAAMMKVAVFIAGNIYKAQYDDSGNHVVSIEKQRDNTYLVTDAE